MYSTIGISQNTVPRTEIGRPQTIVTVQIQITELDYTHDIIGFF